MYSGRTVKPGEPLWLEDDREVADAVLLLDAETCPRCGTRDDEWQDEKGEPYVPEYKATERKCWGCVAIESKQAEVESRQPPQRRGIYVRLRRVLSW